MSNDHAELVRRLNDEADLCKNEGASDIAALLWEAAKAIEMLAGSPPANAELSGAPAQEQR